MTATKNPVALLAYTEEAFRLAKIAAASRCFGLKDDDDQTVAEATMKIMMGMEYGLPPTISLKAIHMIFGSPTLSYQTIAMLIKRSGKYDFKKLHGDDNKCVLEFFENGASLGQVEFTVEQAKKQQLWDKPKSLWPKIPGSMCFARALTTGANQHCSEIFGGLIYSPGADFGVSEDGKGRSTGEFETYGNETAVEIEQAKKQTVKEQKAAAKEAVKQEAAATPADSSGTTSNETTASSGATESPTQGTASGAKQESEQKAATGTTAASSEPANAHAGQPGEEQLAQILAAGTANGWAEEQLEAFVMEFLEKNKVDCTDMESIFKTWNWNIVTEAINHVANNKPA